MQSLTGFETAADLHPSRASHDWTALHSDAGLEVKISPLSLKRTNQLNAIILACVFQYIATQTQWIIC